MAILAMLVSLSLTATSAIADTGGAGGELEEAPVEEAPVLSNTPFDRQGMWIWYVDHSEGGSTPAIIARAKHAGIGTAYIKAGDGATVWSQFTPGLVKALHHGGLDVCAWQYVYGDHPAAEARVGATAVKNGADCLAIDAESEYEGKYASADRYIRSLRAAIGARFPLSLAGFPYVDYHPAFPYSVFLGPGGATYNQPQMYWKAIQTSVRSVYEHTFLYNRLWGHPVYPVGQTYEAPGNGQLKLFRRFAASYGGLAPSWWDWQETTPSEWGALGAASAKRPVTGYRQDFEHPVLKRGSKGDMVVWAQEHLIAAGQEIAVTGLYDRQTITAVRAFQEAKGLFVDGQVGTTTWRSLLTLTAYRTPWAAAPPQAGTARASSAAGRPARKPLSASLPAKGYEIPSG